MMENQKRKKRRKGKQQKNVGNFILVSLSWNKILASNRQTSSKYEIIDNKPIVLQFIVLTL